MIHSNQFSREQVPHVAPKDAVVGVEYHCSAYRVGVFKAVCECQTAAVVVAVCGIVIVVLCEVPTIALCLAVPFVGYKGVFRPVIHHTMAFGKEVMICQTVNGEVVADLRLELRRPVRLRVIGVGYTVVGLALCELVARVRSPVGRYYPRQHCLKRRFHCGCERLRVSRLKATAVLSAPILVCEVVALEKALRGVVVVDFDTAEVFVGRVALPENCVVFLRVIHIAATVEYRFSRLYRVRRYLYGAVRCVGEENYARVSLYRVAYSAVRLPLRGKERLICVVVVRKKDIVRVLARRYIQFYIEVGNGNAVRRHCISRHCVSARVRPVGRARKIEVEI